MPDPSLALAERLLQERGPYSDHCSRKVLALLSVLSGLGLVVTWNLLQYNHASDKLSAIHRPLSTMTLEYMQAKAQHVPRQAISGQSVHLPNARQSEQSAAVAKSVDVAVVDSVGSIVTARRSLLSGAATMGIGAMSVGAAEASITKDADWPNWRSFPLYPFEQRKTIRREAGPGVWTFDQLFGFLYVHAPIRMTVIAMEAGGLFVYAPAAPTRECLGLLQPLIDKHGPIKYIILPTTAPEHAVLAGDFARFFPAADFYATDLQYSFVGFPRQPKLLPSSSQGLALWNGEFKHEVLTVVPGSAPTNFQDTAFFHMPSKTLLVCDSLISVSSDPPQILISEPEYIRALLFHARDSPDDVVVDSPEVRRKGWARIALFFTLFQPAAVNTETGLGPLFGGPKYAMSDLGYNGYLFFTWRDSYKKSFEALSANGMPLVAPLIQQLMARRADETKLWVEKITQWDFERVVPVHCDGPLAIGPAQVVEAFDFVLKGRNDVRVCDEDIALLRDGIDAVPGIYKSKLGPLRGPKCGFA